MPVQNAHRIFGDSCTIYNRYYDEDSKAERWKRTVLWGISWQGGGAVTQRRLSRAGSVLVYIPACVCANSSYAPPRAFLLSPGSHWTLREEDILVRGEDTPPAADETTAAQLLEGTDGMHVIVSVDESLYGGPGLGYWEVCAR